MQHTDTGEPTEHQPVLPNSKIINIEGTNFKLKVHYDQAQQSDDNLSLLKFDVSELDHDVGNHSSDNHNHYHSSDELI